MVLKSPNQCTYNHLFVTLKLSEEILKFYIYKEVRSFDIFVLYNMLTPLILVTTCHYKNVESLYWTPEINVISVILYTNYT